MVDQPSQSPRPLDGIRVLIVEDDPDSRDALAALLEVNGASVQSAGSAAAGRAAFSRRQPHILISDLSMPEEDGYSFLASVRALPAVNGGAIPAVAFSAASPVNARERARDAGFQAFLRKPQDVLLIIPIVVQLLPAAGPR